MSNQTVTGFNGPYAPVNWAQNVAGPNGQLHNTSSDWSASNIEITLILDNLTDVTRVDIKIVVVASGTITFDWSATQGGQCPAGYFVNVNGTQLYDGSSGTNSGSGVTVAVNKGDVFGFYYGVAQNTSPASPLSMEISNFSAPAYNGQSYLLPKTIWEYTQLITSGNGNSSSWLPLSAHYGLFYLGNVYMPCVDTTEYPASSALVVQAFDNSEDEPCLALPLSWKLMGTEDSFNIWTAVAPLGYVSLSPVWVSKSASDTPVLPNYRCVRQDLVELVTTTLPCIWGTGAEGRNRQFVFFSLPRSGYFAAQLIPKNIAAQQPSPLYDLKC